MTRRRPFATTLATVTFSAVTLSSALAQSSAEGTTTPDIELKVVAGYAGFIDEAMIDHGVLGGALRWVATPRLSAEFELLYLDGPGADRDWLFLPSLAWDLRSRGTVVPFVIGGAGWLHTTLPVGVGLYSSSSWTAAGGGGVRIALSPRASLTLEGRIGTEPATRLTAAVGWRIGGR